MRLRILLLVGLTTISGCITNESNNNVIKANNNGIFYNVTYSFNFDKHCYVVELNDKNIDVKPNKYYLVELDAYYYNEEEKCVVHNEYFVSSNELYVYKLDK